MMESTIIFMAMLVWLVACAVFDWRKGEVPNWLTLPGMAAGIAYASLFHSERLVLVAATFIIMLGLFFIKGMGGADVKVLTGVAGLWPAGLVAALLAQGIWGVIVLIRKGRGAEFRAIPAYAAGAALSAIILL